MIKTPKKRKKIAGIDPKTKKWLKIYLRSEMKKVPNDAYVDKGKKPFVFCYAQARFNILMDIDIELGVGAFIRRTK